ncbi:Protein FAM50-like [Hondaea fermentalgiana]|uniref:Protein FAM50-like n=1 Tax=Hondaea fermentalgiana TaxID=2315210 RepID=A0A2R5GRZ3_9STRA|nr:Protein FAM50-like [Hondaea fermentalgiana]|eukprot:GBG31413.1 Protein FAM50-like [Hondaea fermentalgiana]
MGEGKKDEAAGGTAAGSSAAGGPGSASASASRAASLAAAAAASIYTTEGNLSGPRAAQLAKERQHLLEQYQRQREELTIRSAVPDADTLRDVGRRFQKEVLHSEASDRPYGLQTREEYRESQRKAAAIEAGLGSGTLTSNAEHAKADDRAKKRAKRARRDHALLSFAADEEGDDDLDDDDDDDDKDTYAASKKPKKRKKDKKGKKSKKEKKRKRSGDENDGRDGSDDGEQEKELRVIKNPDVETSFLPDRERDEKLRKEEERKHAIKEAEKAKIKAEPLTITYSYWTGEGNRDRIVVTKGTTVSDFLEKVRLKMMKIFPSLRAASADTLMYIKEDMIIPNFLTFYDLIMSNARGRTGPLNKFSVEEDVRLQGDIRVAGRESHAGKVCDRHWYNKNKHIYPASQWEVFDPIKVANSQDKEAVPRT